MDSVFAKNGYVENSLESRLLVSKGPFTKAIFAAI